MQKNLLFAIFLILAFSVNSYSESPPLNRFTIADLTFHSELEKQAFHCITTDSACDWLLAAMATDPEMNKEEFTRYKADFYHFLDQLKTHRKFTRKNKKKISFIFDEIHDQYFKLYKDNPFFSEIFTRGNFNCLTASVLYAIAFDYYNIPYEVVIHPEHVYLLAYPGESSIVVETTNPLQGTDRVFTNREKEKIVQELLEMKMVSQQELAQKGTFKIFSEYYLSEESGDLGKAIGGLYRNEGIKHAQEMDNKMAYESLKKSSVLYPSVINNAMILNFNGILLAQQQYKEEYTYQLLADLEKFLDTNINEQIIISLGIDFMNFAWEKNDISLSDSIYQWMDKHFTHQHIRQEISFTYHYNSALFLYAYSGGKGALDHLEKAYNLKPDDYNTKDMLFNHIVNDLYNNGRTMSWDEIYKEILHYSQKYEAIMQNENFQTLHQSVLLSRINAHYIDGKFEEAEKLREEFENLHQPGTAIDLSILRQIEQIYSRASLYYFRSGRKTSARKVVSSGLQYVPDSYELKSKMEVLR